MNNKMTASAYVVSAEGPEKNKNLRQLQLAVERHADPLVAWASYSDYDDKAMAKCLGCSVETYTLHRMMQGELPHSPLETKHVLKFCITEGVHPADIAPKLTTPEYSCPPYIFRALKFLSQNASHKDDRAFAAAAINLEHQRYERFCETYPAVQAMLEDVTYFIMFRNGDAKQYANALRKIENMSPERKSAQTILRNCFTFEARGATLSDPACHIEDYYSSMTDNVTAQVAEVAALKKTARYEKQELREAASHIFGKEQIASVLSEAERMVHFFEQETEMKPDRRIEILRDRLLAQFDINYAGLDKLRSEGRVSRDMSYDRFVEIFAKASFAFFTRDAEITILSGKATIAEKGHADFKTWLGNMETPEFFFIQSLYINRAIDGRTVSHSLKTTELFQRLDPS